MAKRVSGDVGKGIEEISSSEKQGSRERKPPSKEKRGSEGGAKIDGQVVWEKTESDPRFVPSRAEAIAMLNSEGGSDNARLDRFLKKSKKDTSAKDRFRSKEGELKQVREILTKEFIAAFGDYLAKRVVELHGSAEKPVQIVEVGAGDGRLTELLREALQKLVPDKFKIVATDPQTARINNKFPIETADCQMALEKFQPALVIESWMPYDLDLSAQMRAVPSVQEYILIGEGYGGSCGSDETWSSKRYKGDSFIMSALTQMSKYQVCRLDDAEQFRAGQSSHSQTFSFKRT